MSTSRPGFLNAVFWHVISKHKHPRYMAAAHATPLPGAWAAQRLSVAGTIFGTRAVAKIGPAPRRKKWFFGYHFKAQNMVPVFGPPFIIISTGSPKTGTKNGAGNFAPDCRNPGTLSQKSVAPAPENWDHRRPEGPARGPAFLGRRVRTTS